MLSKSFRHVASILAARMRAGDGDEEETDENANSDKKTSEDDGKNTDQNKRSTDEKSDQDDGNGDRSKKAGSDNKEEPKFTQKQLDDAIAARLNKEREKQKRDEQAKKGEFESLYSEAKTQLEKAESELEKMTARAEAAETQVHRAIDSQVKDWPAEVRDMDPGKEAGVDARMAFVEKGKKAAAAILNSKKAPDMESGKNGNNGNGAKKPSDAVSAYMGRTYAGPPSARKKD